MLKLLSRFILCVACLAVAALFLAKIWLSTPDLWPWLPRGTWEVLDLMFSPKSQEEVADIEFLLFWGLSFFVLSTIWLAVLRSRCGLIFHAKTA
jgi:hypothetical protein